MKLEVKCVDCGQKRTIDQPKNRKIPERCGPCNYSASPFGWSFNKKAAAERSKKSRKKGKSSARGRASAGSSC